MDLPLSWNFLPWFHTNFMLVNFGADANFKALESESGVNFLLKVHMKQNLFWRSFKL